MKKTTSQITKATLKTLRGESPRERLLHRLHCVAMSLNGSSASEAGRIYGDSPRAVAYWVTRFKKHGIDGLADEIRPGRTPRLNASQFKELQFFVRQSAAKSRLLNADTLSQHILKEWNISLTPRHCVRILKRLTT